MLEASVNGTLVTLRKDGRPIALPVWFVVLDHKIYISTRGKKLTRVRNDKRCAFLVKPGNAGLSCGPCMWSARVGSSTLPPI